MKELETIGQELRDIEKYIKKIINDGMSLKIAVDRVKCTIEIKYPPTQNPEKGNLKVVKTDDKNNEL